MYNSAVAIVPLSCGGRENVSTVGVLCHPYPKLPQILSSNSRTRHGILFKGLANGSRGGEARPRWRAQVPARDPISSGHDLPDAV